MCPWNPPIHSSKPSAARSEIGAEIVFADPDSGERPHLPDTYPDTYSHAHASAREVRRSIPRVSAAALGRDRPRTPAGIAWKLQGADPLAEVMVVVSLNLLDPVLDAMETPQPSRTPRAARRRYSLVNPHPDCLAEITVEYPYLQDRYEQFRAAMARCAR